MNSAVNYSVFQFSSVEFEKMFLFGRHRNTPQKHALIFQLITIIFVGGSIWMLMVLLLDACLSNFSHSVQCSSFVFSIQRSCISSRIRYTFN